MPEISQRIGDLQECNNEQIHLSGAVQGHGAALFYSPEDERIQSTSKNAARFFNWTAGSLLGAKISHLLDDATVQTVLGFQKQHPWRQPGVYFSASVNNQEFDVYMYFTQGFFGLEFEPIKKNISSTSDRILQDFVSETKEARTVTELSNIACRYIRRIAGLERVMMYRFLPPSWHGEVVGEDRVMGSHSFMHHRFPSSDIPKPARDLYLRNKVRLIPNSSGDISALEPSLNPETGKAWDLSDSRLRSVSPIHLEYLRNMGVVGSMSFAVIVKGSLWGLIACHSAQALTMTHAQRAMCCTIADVVSLQATLMEDLDGHLLRSSFEARLRKIIELTLSAKDVLSGLMKQHALILETFNGTGVAICGAQGQDISGLVPSGTVLKSLHEKFLQEMRAQEKDILAVQSLRQMFPEVAEKLKVVCGVLAIRINDKDDSLLLVFRPELVRMITWGGDPVKKLENKKFSGQINPRVSFEAWQEKIENQSLPWSSYEIDGAAFIKEVLFDSALVKKNAIDQLTESLRGRSLS